MELRFWILSLICLTVVSAYLDDPQTCEPIRVDMCSHLQYSMTRMPNFLGHQTQNEAIAELQNYAHLVNVLDCSKHLKFLFCSLFVPMCTRQLDGPLVIDPCRSMCLQVKSDCEPVLDTLNIEEWPIDCSRLPENRPGSKEQLCMAPNDMLQVNLSDSSNPTVASRPRNPLILPLAPTTTNLPEVCPANFYYYENSSCTDLCSPACKDCVPRCRDIYFTTTHKSFAFSWMAVWSSLAIISTVATLAVFCVEPARFKYPTRPVVFMAFSYLMNSLAYLIRLFVPANEISCRTESDGTELLITNGLESTLCIVIFLIQYYFTIASSIWWLVLTLTWYLAASRKWGLEALNSIACYFHLFAWAVPAVLTIAILITGQVDSNELTGMCYVGNHDRWSLLGYLIVPSCLLLLVGEVFLLAGFAALFRIRTNLKSQIDNINIRKLEKLMAKIGVFAILYTVPAVCVLGANIHEFINMDAWRCIASTVTDSLQQSIPTVEIHMLKIFMTHVVGITIVMWVMSSKTVRSCQRRCCREKSLAHTTLSYATAAPSASGSKHTASYIVASPSSAKDSDRYMQHYQFPAQHPLRMAADKHHRHILHDL